MRDACSQEEKFGNSACNHYVDYEALDRLFERDCHNKHECSIATTVVDKTPKGRGWKLNPELFPPKEHLKKEHDRDLSIKSLETCTDPRSAFFIQYTCQASAEDAAKKFDQL